MPPERDEVQVLGDLPILLYALYNFFFFLPCTSITLSKSINICICVYMHTHTYVYIRCVYGVVYMNVYICISVKHLHICIHIHTPVLNDSFRIWTENLNGFSVHRRSKGDMTLWHYLCRERQEPG